MSFYKDFKWLGNEHMYLDEINIVGCDDIVIGQYGGNINSGVDKNEDAVFIMNSNKCNWKFAMILDAHTSIQSATLVINTIYSYKEKLLTILDSTKKDIFKNLEAYFVDLFSNDYFKEKCSSVRGEAACLICVQKDQFLWWFSVGDNSIYLLHPDLAKLGQYRLNQRQFFEWIGQENTFSLEVPCYSSGIRELREGINYIYLLTDGVLECGERPFENSAYLYSMLAETEENKDIKTKIYNVLGVVNQEGGEDNATIIGWKYINSNKARWPSR